MLDPSTLRVSEISAASPDMDAAQYVELVESIRTLGQQVPIIVSGDQVLDGRKRLRACGELGVEVEVRDIGNGQDPEQTARALNILRTHYSPSQRAMFAARLATRPRGNQKSQLRHLVPSVQQAGAMTGVDRGTVARAKAVRRDGAREVTAAVEAGRLTLHSAQQIVSTVSKEEQPAAVRKVIAASAGKRRQTPASVLGTEPTNGRHPMLRKKLRPNADAMVERAIVSLEGVCTALTSIDAETVTKSKADGWADSIEAAAAEIRRFARRLRK